MLFRDAPTTGGIYLITNTVDGKRYVGQSANIRGRWYTHRWALQRNRSGSRRLQNAWNRHGEASFEFTVLCLVPDVGTLDAWEQWYFDALAPEYNISRRPGTRRGVPQPLDAVARTAAQMRGRPKSAEWKRQASEARTGVRFSQAHCDSIRASKQHVSAETRAKQSACKKGVAPLIATTAAAIANKGKRRPPHVVEAIREGQRRRWARLKDAAQSAL